jgi:rhodanese-related sulfurtransferase
MKHSPGFLKLVADAKQQVRECSASEVKDRLDRGDTFHFLDVREDHEYDEDHAAGARHLGRGVLERDIESLIPDRDADIVLYCGGGFRSALAAESLGKMGYRRVISMDGGMRAWRAAGYPLERGAVATSPTSGSTGP